MRQITIITDNRPGLVADISEVLAGQGINIETIYADAVRRWAVVRLTVSDYDGALQALNGLPYKALTESILLLCVEDRPGALARIARRFKDANLDLRSVRFIDRDDGCCLVAISTDRLADAAALVQDVMVS